MDPELFESNWLRSHPDCLDPGAASALAEGLLTGDERVRAEAHMAQCADCRQHVSALIRSAREDGIAREGARSLAPRTCVGRYQLERWLGTGAMGIVYAAHDPKLDRRVALKMVHAETHPAAQALLEREAKAMARLSHPNVVTVYDTGVHEGQIFIVMALVDGITVRTWLRAESRSFREVLGAFAQAGRGLAAAHAQGLVHRDFKPENVLRDKEGRVYVTDFGLARMLETAASSTALNEQEPIPASAARSFAGTPAYMAPELQAGKPADARSDQFSFCVALYEALYGQYPFTGETRVELAETMQHERLREPPPGSAVPARVHRAIVRGLRAAPDARFESVDRLLDALGDKPSPRWTRAAIALGVVAVIAIPAGYRYERVLSLRACTETANHLAGHWDEGRKTAIRAAFLGTNKTFATDAWSRVERLLDAYAMDWTSARREVCEATHTRGGESQQTLALKASCLDSRMREIVALTDVLARADADVVAGAVGAVQSLPLLAPCADGATLLARARPPADASAVAQIAAIRDKLAEARALQDTGKAFTAAPIAEAAVHDAEASNDQATLAESLVQYGLAQSTTGHAKDAEMTLHRAEALADAVGDDATRARSLAAIMMDAPILYPNSDRLSFLNAQVNAAIVRMGGDPEIDIVRAINFARGLRLENRLREAEQEYRAALPRIEKATGPTSIDALNVTLGLGMTQVLLDAYEEAWVTLSRARDIIEATLGAHHPSMGNGLAARGSLLYNQMRFEESADDLRQALQIHEEAWGPTSRKLMPTLTNLGSVLIELGHPERAIPYLSRALEIQTREDSTSPHMSYPLGALGEAYLALNDQARARDHLQRAIALRGDAARDPDTAWKRFVLAKVFWSDPRARQRAAGLATEARDALRASHASPLEARNLQIVETWLASPKK